MAIVYKFLSDQGPSEIFTLASGAVRTRQATWAKNLLPKFARTDQRKFSFSFRTVGIWNGLPDRQQSTEDFRKRLKNSNFLVPDEQRPES